MKLKGKWALVTGGSRGIGRGICLKLAEEGCNIAVNYTSNKAAAEETVKRLEKMGVEAYGVKADVSHAGGALERTCLRGKPIPCDEDRPRLRRIGDSTSRRATGASRLVALTAKGSAR